MTKQHREKEQCCSNTLNNQAALGLTPYSEIQFVPPASVTARRTGSFGFRALRRQSDNTLQRAYLKCTMQSLNRLMSTAESRALGAGNMEGG